MESPETRFARNGDIHLAYQTVGRPLDLLLVDTWVHHVEAVLGRSLISPDSSAA